MFDPVILTQKLVQTFEVRECLEFISDILNGFGFKCEFLTFNNIPNLFSYKKNQNVEKNLLFLGHVDVVPIGDINNWKYDPFSGKISEEKLYGRGCVDMKGGIACFISAIEKNIEQNGSIFLIITGDEEGIAEYGTKAVIKHLNEVNQLPKFDFAIIGEPTGQNVVGDHIKIGSRGSLNVKVTAIGKAGHVAYSSKAINPIDSLIQFLNDIKNNNFNDGNDIFEPTNLEITSIDVSNLATNVIPESVTARFNIRFNKNQNSKNLVDVIEVYSNKFKDVNWLFEYDFASDPFCSKESENFEILSNICKNHTGFTPKISAHGASSDAKFLENICPFAEIGLLTDQAHKINENTKILDLNILSKIYYDFLLGYFCH